MPSPSPSSPRGPSTGPSTGPTGNELLAILSERFGHTAFHPAQKRAVEAVVAGRDALVTMPTGAGKSLVYQLPAVALEGTTLVVSPLIALMKDQVDGLVARGVRATFVNSSLNAKERAERLGKAARGAYDLVFVTPERFRSEAFRASVPQWNVTRMAVDEAHCISEWGHDFRPDYWRLGDYRKVLGDPPTVALTATATPRVAEDIVRALRLDDPLIVRTGIERPNLFFGVHRVDTREERIEHLASRLGAIDGAGIVYSTLIRDLEDLHDELRRRGIASLVYHGKLSNRERREMQERFMGSERDVVLATNAFGMGVDKADIRFVLHAQIPRTLEAWTQEVGRAGRDGKPSFCELAYLEEDLAIQQNFIGWANPSREYMLGVWETLRGWGERLQAKDLDDLRAELLIKNKRDNRVSITLKWFEVLGATKGSFETHDLELVRDLEPSELPDFVGSEDKHKTDLEALLKMMRFAGDVETCRRQRIADHFELEGPDGPCGACDACTRTGDWVKASFAPRPATERGGAQGRSRGNALPAAGKEGDAGKEGHDKIEDDPEAPFRRGDWVRIDGRHLGHVVRVEGDGKRIKLVVESATDLKRRTIDPRRKRVEKVE